MERFYPAQTTVPSCDRRILDTGYNLRLAEMLRVMVAAGVPSSAMLLIVTPISSNTFRSETGKSLLRCMLHVANLAILQEPAT